MKLLQLTAIFGGTALAGSISVDNLAVGRGEAALSLPIPAATTTFYTTSVYTVTKCGTDVIDCPTGTAVVTSVIAVTTTVCPFSSTWTSAPSSGIPSVSGTLSNSGISVTSSKSSASVPTASSGSHSLPSPVSGSAVGTASLPATSIVLTIQTSVPASSLAPSSIATETSPSNSSLTSRSIQTTYTDAVPTSRVSSSSSSGSAPGTGSLATSHSSSTEVGPTSKSSATPSSTASPFVPPSGTPSSSSLGSSLSSNTEAVLTSSLSATPAPSLSSQPSSSPASNPHSSTTEEVSASKSSAPYGSTLSVPYLAPNPSVNSTTVTSVDSTSSSTEATPTSKPSVALSSPISEGTTRITSVLTQTFTSTITISGSKNLSATEVISISGSSIPPGTVTFVFPSTSTNVQGQPSSGLPSGSSGYPFPSSNGTWPSPTIPVQPINAGPRFVGKSSSTVAIVIAFAVAFDNRWLPLTLCLNTVEATSQDMALPAYQNMARSARLPESDFSKVIDTVTGYYFLPRQFYQWMFLMPIIIWFVLLDIHFLRFILWRQGPPRNPAMERAVQELVRERDNEEEELNYYIGLHNDWVRRRRTHIPVQPA